MVENYRHVFAGRQWLIRVVVGKQNHYCKHVKDQRSNYAYSCPSFLLNLIMVVFGHLASEACIFITNDYLTDHLLKTVHVSYFAVVCLVKIS
jgi:hypothetical protein